MKTIIEPGKYSGRIYNKEVLDYIVNEINEGKALGQLGHNDINNFSLTRVSHGFNNGVIIDKTIEVEVLPLNSRLIELTKDESKFNYIYEFSLAGTGSINGKNVISDYKLTSINLIRKRYRIGNVVFSILPKNKKILV